MVTTAAIVLITAIQKSSLECPIVHLKTRQPHVPPELDHLVPVIEAEEDSELPTNLLVEEFCLHDAVLPVVTGLPHIQLSGRTVVVVQPLLGLRLNDVIPPREIGNRDTVSKHSPEARPNSYIHEVRVTPLEVIRTPAVVNR